ncbi:hypothetical protein HN873_052557, partial [Arachis hypogaea]
CSFVHLNLCRKNLIPNTVTYNTLIDGLGKSKRISGALELFIEMHDKGQPSIFIYNFLIDALCKNRLLDKALVLFSKMEEIGINQIYTHTTYLLMAYDLPVRGYCLDVQTYNIMINSLSREGLFEDALALLSKKEHDDCIPDANSYINSLYAGAEDFGIAMTSLSLILQPKRNRFRSSSTHQKFKIVFFMLKRVMMTLDVKTKDIACEEKIENMEKKKKMKEAMILVTIINIPPY